MIVLACQWVSGVRTGEFELGDSIQIVNMEVNVKIYSSCYPLLYVCVVWSLSVVPAPSFRY